MAEPPPVTESEPPEGEEKAETKAASPPSPQKADAPNGHREWPTFEDLFGSEGPTPADEGEPTEPAGSGADFAALIDRRYAPLPDGRYLVELLARDIKPFRTEWKSGVAFVVGIRDGDFARREIALSLITEGSPAMQGRVHHDCQILCNWKEGLGIPRAKDAEDLVRRIGKAARDGKRRVYLTIDIERRKATLEARIVKVEVERTEVDDD